jgi:hypothetical protein
VVAIESREAALAMTNSSKAYSLFRSIRSLAMSWHSYLIQPSTILTPARYTQWARCSKDTLQQCFPRHMHQSQVHEVLGDPDKVSRLSHVTMWRYQIVEYWLPHSMLCAEPPIVCHHDLVFVFDGMGKLEDADRVSW